jgi:hypothetical protein
MSVVLALVVIAVVNFVVDFMLMVVGNSVVTAVTSLEFATEVFGATVVTLMGAIVVVGGKTVVVVSGS